MLCLIHVFPGDFPPGAPRPLLQLQPAAQSPPGFPWIFLLCGSTTFGFLVFLFLGWLPLEERAYTRDKIFRSIAYLKISLFCHYPGLLVCQGIEFTFGNHFLLQFWRLSICILALSVGAQKSDAIHSDSWPLVHGLLFPFWKLLDNFFILGVLMS